MHQHGVVAGIVALLCLASVWTGAPLSRAWAQTPSDVVIFVDRAILAYDAQQYELALQELQAELSTGHRLLPRQCPQ